LNSSGDNSSISSLVSGFFSTEWMPLVSYNGIHSVLKNPLTSDELEELSPELFNWVLYENKLFKYDEMSDDARRNADKVFPCLNKTLHRALNIPFPAPDKSNRYLRYRTEIDNFKKKYLYSTEIEQFIKVNAEWLRCEPYTLIGKNSTLNTLEFGKGKTDTEPKNGMRLYGPKTLSPDLKTVFFFICHLPDVHMASTVNAYMKGALPGFVDSQTQLMPYSFTYFPINKNQYLLYNNGLQKDTIFDAKEGYPFPMKLSVQYFAPNSTLSIQAEEGIIPGLFEQICRFSQLYWKSVSRQSLPVTLRYPEMLAQIDPHFARPELPRTGKETLWFL